MNYIPDPNRLFPNEYGTSCFIKNAVSAPNISVGDYSYYDSPDHPENFEHTNVLFNHPEFGDRLIIGKFCAIASGTQFIMGPANHRISSVSTYPFNVFGGLWQECTPPHLSQLPRKGDTIIGNDVWFGRNCTILPGTRIGDGCIVAAHAVVSGEFPPYSLIGGNPARLIRKRFDDELIDLLLRFCWWNLPAEELVEVLPLLCNPNLEAVKSALKQRLHGANEARPSAR